MRDVVGHGVGDALMYVDVGGQDCGGVLLSDVLDAHAALGGGDDHRSLRLAVHKDCEVEFAAGEFALDEEDGVADSAAFAGLFGDELVADHLLGEDAGFGWPA